MPRHLAMWLAAGGSALVSAAITYAVTRPRLALTSGDDRETDRDIASRWTGSMKKWRSRRTEVTALPRNTAFDEYRTNRLRELDDDEREFREFLEQLRGARDRAEFDQFMADRKNRPLQNPDTPPEAA